MLEYFIHEAGKIVFEGFSDLIHDICAFFFFFLKFVFEQSEFFLHDLYELVFLFLPLNNFCLDFSCQVLRYLFKFLQLRMRLLLIESSILNSLRFTCSSWLRSCSASVLSPFISC